MDTVSPGEVIDDYLNSFGMTQDELAVQANITREITAGIMAGEIPLSLEIALKLEEIFRRPVSFWLTLEEIYQLEQSRGMIFGRVTSKANRPSDAAFPTKILPSKETLTNHPNDEPSRKV